MFTVFKNIVGLKKYRRRQGQVARAVLGVRRGAAVGDLWRGDQQRMPRSRQDPGKQAHI